MFMYLVFTVLLTVPILASLTICAPKWLEKSFRPYMRKWFPTLGTPLTELFAPRSAKPPAFRVAIIWLSGVAGALLFLAATPAILIVSFGIWYSDAVAGLIRLKCPYQDHIDRRWAERMWEERFTMRTLVTFYRNIGRFLHSKFTGSTPYYL